MYRFYFSFLLSFLLFGFYFSAWASTTDTLVYSRLLSNRKVGFIKTWNNPDGSLASFQKMNDRGRGDSLYVFYRVNDRAIPVQMEIQGHNYLKKPVKESFSMDKGLARWQNDSEKEQIAVEGNAFYLPLSGYAGGLLPALLKNFHLVKTLPGGNSIELSLVKEFILKHKGQNRKLQLYRVRGLDFAPVYGWMDENKTEFATVNAWSATIRQGFEEMIPELLQLQQKEEDSFYREITAKITETPEDIVIRNVNLFDAKDATTVPRQHVWIKNGKIFFISAGEIIAPKTAKVIDGSRYTLLPGLFDMHVHYSSHLDGLMHLSNGVTNVRDLGGPFTVMDFKNKIEKGEVAGPTINVLSGLIDGAGEFQGPTPALANSKEEAVAWVDTFARKGYQQIKIYSSIRPEWVFPIVVRAKTLGLRISGHIPAFMTAEKAILEGYQEIQHLNMLFLNFYGDSLDTRSPARFILPAQKAASFDFNSAKFKYLVRMMLDRKIVIDPTVNIFEDMFTSRPGKTDEAFRSILHRMPVMVQRNLRNGGNGLPYSEKEEELFRRSFDAFLKMIKTLHDSGVQIVPGTDNWPGFSLHRELELYVKAGIPPTQVLKLATYDCARLIGRSNDLGSIEKGKKANLLLVEGDPTHQISDIRKVVWVMKEGKIYDPAKMLDVMGIRNYKAE